MRSRAALEGERKQVTVLFADVKGSMELAEQVDPEEWHRIMDRFFQILADGVHRFEGTVNQYTGDGIMALFGAPIAHEDHAQRACWAALHLMEALRPYACQVKREHGLTLSTRMGLHSGEVVVGTIGDDLRMDYTALGHTVGLAQRMESLASPDTVYLSGATARLVAGFFELEDLGSFAVKGVREPVPVFQLVGAGQQRTRFDVARARGLTRFVGREADMQALDAALAQANAGSGQVVGVVAEAGTGKSRLCFEFTEQCRGRGLRVIEGHAVAHGRNIPLRPVLQVFRAYYGITEEDDARAVREKIAGRMVLLDEAFRDDLPLLFDFFGAPDAKTPAVAMDPEARQRRLFAILRRVNQLGGRDGVTVTLVEDLHWIDRASDAFIAQMVEGASDSHGLLLLNFRPEYRADWMHKSYYRQLPLAPLGPAAIRALLDDLLGGDASLAGLAAAIHARSGGNPFFAEEIVQSLIEGGTLVGARASYRLTTPPDRLAIPGTVQALLAARIDRLPERERQVLQTAAVIGKDFDEPLLRAVLFSPSAQSIGSFGRRASTSLSRAGSRGSARTVDGSVSKDLSARPEPVEGPLPKGEEDLAAALAGLQAAEFVHERALYPVAEYSFKHPLTQEVALGSQLQERRRSTHARVAQAVEDAHPDDLDEHAALIAHHWGEAGRAVEAAGWYQRAAEWVSRRDPYEAAQHWRSVYRLLRDHADDSPSLALRLQACVHLTMAAWRVGMALQEEVTELFEEGKRLAERAGDSRMLALIISGYATWLLLSGEIRAGYERHREAYALAYRLSPSDRAVVLGGLVEGSYATGRLEEAVRLLHEILEIVGGDATLGMDTFGFSFLCWANFELVRLGHWLRGRLAEAWRESDRAIALARTHKQTDVLCWALGNRAALARDTGSADPHQLDQALHHAAESVDVAERLAGPSARGYALQELSIAHAFRGEWSEAVAAIESALAMARERQVCREEEVCMLANLAHACRGAGDRQRALAVAREAVALSDVQGASPGAPVAHLELARALRATAGAPAAGEIAHHLDRGMSFVQQTGARVFEPQIGEERARLAELRGDRAAASEELQRAHALYVEIGATGHAERLARELSGRDH